VLQVLPAVPAAYADLIPSFEREFLLRFLDHFAFITMPPESKSDSPPTPRPGGDAVGPEQIALVQQLFVQNLVPLRGVIRAFIRDPHRVDDLVQETFLTVTAKAGSFREGTSFRAWAFTIARFKVLESLRKNTLSDALSEDVIQALFATEPASPPNEERMEHLAGCMKKLAPQARRTVELRYRQEHTPPQIASIMGWSVSAVNVTLSRARALLRTCVERQMTLGNP
jgi:RNA polymerase sigma-70 factor (ECF subfamily)